LLLGRATLEVPKWDLSFIFRRAVTEAGTIFGGGGLYWRLYLRPRASTGIGVIFRGVAEAFSMRARIGSLNCDDAWFQA
jgi:hypothetical protein